MTDHTELLNKILQIDDQALNSGMILALSGDSFGLMNAYATALDDIRNLVIDALEDEETPAQDKTEPEKSEEPADEQPETQSAFDKAFPELAGIADLLDGLFSGKTQIKEDSEQSKSPLDLDNLLNVFLGQGKNGGRS